MVDFDAVNDFRRRSLNPEHPVLRGSAQNPDIFFQAREACNKYYENVVDVTEKYMQEVNKKIGTNYQLFNYYGAEDAEDIIIAMGSVCDTIKETVDYLNANGRKTGLVTVSLYRPFSAKHLIGAIPKSVKRISVLDRTKEPGSLGEPLFLDVVAALADSEFKNVPVYGGRYGLGSKDTNPACIASVFTNMEADAPKKRFTVGIDDDVTYLSLPVVDFPDTTPAGTRSCKFWGLGSDGTVGANQNTIKIIGDNTDMYAQGYFAYDSKKSGGLTISHLRFGTSPITSTYYINKADFVACSTPSYVTKYNMVEDLKEGGTFLLNCQWTPEQLDAELPGHMKRYIAKNKINLYIIDAISIAKELGLRGRTNTVLQSAFFNLTGIIPADKANELMKDAATRSFSKKGEEIVKMNHDAIDRGANSAVKVEVPAAWADAEDVATVNEVTADRPEMVDFVTNILDPINAQKGDALPVSAFLNAADGTFPQGSAAFEKRGIAVDVPAWDSTKCIQCHFCSLVCPHAVIRPVVMTEEEAAAAPAAAKVVDMKQLPGYKYTMSVSVLDCTGCGSCANVCPAKALTMTSAVSQAAQQEVFDFGVNIPEKDAAKDKFQKNLVKSSQLNKPLLEFSGACGGCGETPYAKLVTQLFGDRMYIANATGCSSIWGGSAPSTPYTVNKEGKGPAWSNSLFEDNAEFGYGMMLANNQIRDRLTEKVNALADAEKVSDDVKAACRAWLDTKDDSTENAAPAKALVEALKNAQFGCDCCKAAAADILTDSDYLAKKSQWIFGGDGWRPRSRAGFQ